MSREIKYRAKVKYNGNHYFSGCWVKGFYYKNRNEEAFIINTEPDEFGNQSFDKVQVDPETVCQCTGIKDSNGEDIFEGDILERKDTKCTFKVIWKSDGYYTRGIYDSWLERDIEDRKSDISLSWIKTFKIEIIGNIHGEKSDE